MYPLNSSTPWPVNQWYIAGFSSEVTRTLQVRTFLNRRVLLFRDEQGTAHALSSICPHRMMPLELGSLVGDRLVCGYHGLTFDTAGTCVDAPTSSQVPRCALTVFPLRESSPLLWIWLGDPQRADATPLPPQDAIGVGTPGWLTQCVEHYQLKARYTLLIDNLFDLSHLGFIHASIVGAGGISLVKPTIEKREDRLVVSRTLVDVPADGFQRLLFPSSGERMSVSLSTELVGISLINAGGPYFDGPRLESPLLVHLNFIHAITPETEHSTHYWILMTRDFRTDDAHLSGALAAQNVAVVAQDRTTLEAIEQLLQEGGNLPREISMQSDTGAIRARLRIMQMIRNDGHTTQVAEQA